MNETAYIHLFARLDGTYEVETRHERATQPLVRTNMSQGDALNYLLGYTHDAVHREFIFTSSIEVQT